MFDKSLYGKAYRQAHKEELKEKARIARKNSSEKTRRRHKSWRDRNPQKIKKYIEYQRKWLKEHPSYTFEHNLKTKYGMSILQFNEMLQQQQHKCMICSFHMDPPCVDHDHVTKEVRALLCFQCNALLGNAKENPITLRRAAEYVEGFGNPSKNSK